MDPWRSPFMGSYVPSKTDPTFPPSLCCWCSAGNAGMTPVNHPPGGFLSGNHPSGALVSFFLGRGFPSKSTSPKEEAESLFAPRNPLGGSGPRLTKCVQTAISSKQLGCEGPLAKLVAEACARVMPPTPSRFDVDNVRVTKARKLGSDGPRHGGRRVGCSWFAVVCFFWGGWVERETRRTATILFAGIDSFLRHGQVWNICKHVYPPNG